MDWDDRIDIDNYVERWNWSQKYLDCRTDGTLLQWISSFREDKSLGEYASEDPADDLRGSFNWVCKVIFPDGQKWAVRFPRGGKVKFPDEKVEIEVATMSLLRKDTEIPIPQIHAWGLAADNPLGLGPFIISEFVEGVNLASLIDDPEAEGEWLVRQDVDEDFLRLVYRQITRIILQLDQLNFRRIGSLSQSSGADDSYNASVMSRPLTWKAHETLNCGGVDTLCSRDDTFASTTDFFNHILNNDIRHLREQPNSVDNEEDAKLKFTYCTALQQLVPRFVDAKLDKGPFKLICDDFGPNNLIVKSQEDPTIVGVVDWEWSYTGPAQFLWSAPRWLMLSRPNGWLPSENLVERYERYLNIYLQVLDEEEKAFYPDAQSGGRPSDLVRDSRKDGRLWFHNLLCEGFNGPDYVPYVELGNALPEFAELVSRVPPDTVEAFVQAKMGELDVYDSELIKKKEWKESWEKSLNGDVSTADSKAV